MHPIHALSDALVEATCADSPTNATFAGVRGWDDRWDDFGPAGVASRHATARDFSARLDALPPATDPYDVLAVRVIRAYLDERLAFYASADPWLDLNNITSTFQVLPMVFDVVDTATPAGAEAATRRLETLPAAVDTYHALLAEGLRAGNVVARRQVEAAIRQGRAQAGPDSHWRELGARIAAEHPALATRLVAAAEGAHAAVAGLADWLEGTYLRGASPVDGVGRERYLRCARAHLGMELDPEEAYAWGWAEIRRIEAEMRAVAAEIGPGTVREVAARLDEDPAFSVEVPGPFLDAMRDRQRSALERLDGVHFRVPEAIRRIDVRLAPPGGKIGAYYVPPSEDLARPGTVWYSPGSKRRMPLWQEVTTAYHEGFPGHHLQCAMQVLLADRLTRFQRVFGFNVGYAEGWALYAEELMHELGFLDHPAYVLGKHAGQLVRACRVVVDIGLHLDLPIPASADFHPGERWTPALAEEMLVERCFLDAPHAADEVVRYLGWPAQAIGYKLGQRVILGLREERRGREGPAFDLARFNADVVGVGSVGLGTLREVILG